MVDGTVVFKGRCPTTEFDEIEFSPPAGSGVDRGSIVSSRNDGLSLTLYVKNAESVEKGLVAARGVAERVRTILAFQLSTHIEPLRVTERAFIEQGDSGALHGVSHTLTITDRAEGWVKLGQQSCQAIAQSLGNANSKGGMFYEQFCAALGMQDAMSQFMCLYNIVLALSNDRQEDVDKFVLSKDANIATYPPHRPRKSGVLETEYTRLRNEVGHIRPGTSFDSTRDEMGANLSGLIQITKAIIGSQP